MSSVSGQMYIIHTCAASGAKRCSGTTDYQTCSDSNGDGYLEWGAATACAAGQTCYDGVCAASCNNECTASGAKQCSSTTGYHICEFASGCYKWGAATACPSGQTCLDGVCAATADTTPPTVYFASPANNAPVGGIVSVLINASDNIGVSYVEFYIGSELKQTITSTSASNIYSYNWDTLRIGNGDYKLTAKAYDASKNFGFSLPAAVKVSNPANIVCTSHTYGDWGACTAAGTQTKTIASRYPASCVLPSSILETVSQACTYTKIPCVYDYGSWSTTCDASGFRTRPYTATPAGCSQDIAPAAKEPCVVEAVPCTSYTYTGWSVCDSSGKQKQTISARTPAGCALPSGVLETKTQACDGTVPCTSYTYDAWSTCSNTGIQTHKILTKSPEGCDEASSLSYAPDLKQACDYYLPCTSHTYTDWSACDSSGKQKQTIAARTPAGCSLPSGVSEIKTRTCVYKIPCTSYTYTDWSECDSTGIQTHKILTKSPEGCGDTGSAALTQNCAYRPCKDYAYTTWGACDAAGLQQRKVIMSSPSGCGGGEAPFLEKKCDACEYNYSEWGECQISGVQNRRLVSQSSGDCAKIDFPVLERSCDYKLSNGPGQTANRAGTVIDRQTTPCAYSYSDWGACVSKRQTRMLISALPEGCDASVAPDLNRDCGDSAAGLPPLAADAPVPAPGSMLATGSGAGVAPANLNGRTDAGWQTYYFGAADCRDANVCAGLADPDNDGLSNDDEYRFGTNPKSSDTDLDGRVDASEIKDGRNPLVADSAVASDAVVYENPKGRGQELAEIYQIDQSIGYDKDAKKLKLTGRALPNSYVSIYIYSEEPIILTVKTDSEGNWLYTVDKPEDG